MAALVIYKSRIGKNVQQMKARRSEDIFLIFMFMDIAFSFLVSFMAWNKRMFTCFYE